MTNDRSSSTCPGTADAAPGHRIFLLELAGLGRAQIPSQIAVQAGDGPLTIGVRFRALETGRLHSLLYRRHVREILRQYRAPARIAERRVFSFGLRLFVLGEQNGSASAKESRCRYV